MQKTEQAEFKSDSNSNALAEPSMLGICHTLNPAPRVIQRHYRARTLAEILGISQATLWRWVKNGSLAKPVKMGKGRTVAWRESDIEAFLTSSDAAPKRIKPP